MADERGVSGNFDLSVHTAYPVSVIPSLTATAVRSSQAFVVFVGLCLGLTGTCLAANLSVESST